LKAGRESRAAGVAQAALDHRLNDFFRLHLGQRVVKRFDNHRPRCRIRCVSGSTTPLLASNDRKLFGEEWRFGIRLGHVGLAAFERADNGRRVLSGVTFRQSDFIRIDLHERSLAAKFHATHAAHLPPGPRPRSVTAFWSCSLTTVFEDTQPGGHRKQRSVNFFRAASSFSLIWRRSLRSMIHPLFDLFHRPRLGYEYYLAVDPTGRRRRLRPRPVARHSGLVRALSLNSVPGVAEVASIGGFARQYQIEVSSLRMRQLGVTLQMVMDAVASEQPQRRRQSYRGKRMEFVVRGIGLVNSSADLENIVLQLNNGTPVYLKDVARIQMGGRFPARRAGRGRAGSRRRCRRDAHGENAMAVINAVETKKSPRFRRACRPASASSRFYDRSELIARTIDHSSIR